jgi:hypothetical protein
VRFSHKNVLFQGFIKKTCLLYLIQIREISEIGPRGTLMKRRRIEKLGWGGRRRRRHRKGVVLRQRVDVRDIAGHIEQAESGAIHKSQQEHKHFCPLLPTALAFVS